MWNNDAYAHQQQSWQFWADAITDNGFANITINPYCLPAAVLIYTVDCERLKNSGYAKNNAYTCQMIPYSNFSSVLAASFSTTHSKSWGMFHGLMLSILGRWCNRLSRFVADENWFCYDSVVFRRTTFLAVARFPAWRNVRTCMFQLGKIHEWFILIWHNTYSYYSILVKSTDFLWYCA